MAEIAATAPRVTPPATAEDEIVFDGHPGSLPDGLWIELGDQLVGNGKLAAVGGLTAGAAHEINNPLFAILGLVEFLLRDAEPGTKAHERLLLVQETGSEIKEIVRALLDFARDDRAEPIVLPLADLSRQALDLVRRTSANKGIEIVEDYPDESPVEAIPGQIKQVLLNLVANSRQAMPDGGRLTVRVFRDGDHVVASVADTGAGIPFDLAGRIFGPFFTTRRESGGAGLGLAVGRVIATAHGGTLELAPESAAGTTFTLRLPVAGRRS